MKRSKWSKYGDAVLILILGVIAIVMEFQLIEIKPNEQEIPGMNSPNFLFSYPEMDDSVSDAGLIVICLLPWILLFLITTLWLYFKEKHFSLPHWLNTFSIGTRMVLFDFFVCFLIVDTIKLSVGSPRPYFIEAYNVYGADSSEVLGARLSFPSGHASLSMTTMSLMSMVLYQSWQFTQNMHFQQIPTADKMGWDNPHSFCLCSLWWSLRDAPLIGILLVSSPTFLALYCGCTRITDYKHFAADILGGFLIGVAVAYVSHLAFWNELYMEFEYRLRVAAGVAGQSPSSTGKHRNSQKEEKRASNLDIAMNIVEQNSEQEDGNDTEQEL